MRIKLAESERTGRSWRRSITGEPGVVRNSPSAHPARSSLPGDDGRCGETRQAAAHVATLAGRLLLPDAEASNDDEAIPRGGDAGHATRAEPVLATSSRQGRPAHRPHRVRRGLERITHLRAEREERGDRRDREQSGNGEERTRPERAASHGGLV
jgi:hypothetical protein